MTTTPDHGALIQRLFQIGALRFGDFTLKDGRRSPFYLDLRVLVSYPDVLARVARAMLQRAAGLPHERLMQSNFRDSYWTVAQLITHHTVNGCNLGTGDLLGSGTQSGPQPGQGGSLLELTEGGKRPVALANGESRNFLEDGDSIVLRAFCERPGTRRIGFGVCEGQVLAARAPA